MNSNVALEGGTQQLTIVFLYILLHKEFTSRSKGRMYCIFLDFFNV
jgi:hypothetical protein